MIKITENRWIDRSNDTCPYCRRELYLQDQITKVKDNEVSMYCDYCRAFFLIRHMPFNFYLYKAL